MQSHLKILCCLIIISACFFVFQSCRKDKNSIRVEGRVHDPNSNVDLEGALVVFSAKKITDGVYNAGFEELSRAYTDASGAFSFEMEEDYVSAYRFSVSKAGYFSVAEELSANDIRTGETYMADFSLFPVGYIRLEVRNFAPIDSADYITYTFSSGYLNAFECCDNSIHHGAGEFFSDTIICKTYGNQNVTITWNVTKSQISTQHSGTVYCAAFDTSYFQINY